MSDRGRSTVASTEERVSIVYTMLLDGYTRSEILKAGKEWKVSDRTIDDYIAKAKEEILEVNKDDRAENMSIVLKNLWNLYHKSQLIAEFGDAHRILMSIAKLQGLEETVIHHTVSERPLQQMSKEERRALTDKLLNSGKH